MPTKETPADTASVSPAPVPAGDHCPWCRGSGTRGSTTPEPEPMWRAIRNGQDERRRRLAEPVWVVPCLRMGWGNCRNTRTENHRPTLAEMDCGEHDTTKENVA